MEKLLAQITSPQQVSRNCDQIFCALTAVTGQYGSVVLFLPLTQKDKSQCNGLFTDLSDGGTRN